MADKFDEAHAQHKKTQGYFRYIVNGAHDPYPYNIASGKAEILAEALAMEKYTQFLRQRFLT